MPEMILPGTYISVRDEGLISAGRVVTGNIGIVGTAAKGPVNAVQILGSFTEAKEIFGEADPWQGGAQNELTLIRALEQIYNNGGKTVYAVRTAKGSPTKAAFQTRSESNDPLTKLEAVTPGSWGNDIQIEIRNAEQPALVQERFNKSAMMVNGKIHLKRGNVVPNSPLNNIMVTQSNGLQTGFEVVYSPAVPTVSQVAVNPATGEIIFEASKIPADNDKITARYEVPAANAKKVVLSYQNISETYIAADAFHLAEQINASSNLVKATSDPDFYDNLPQNTKVPFGTGGENTAGVNGADAEPADYKNSLALLEQDIINIVVLAGQDASKAQMVTNLLGHLNSTKDNKRERIGIIGSNGSNDINVIAGHSLNSDRIVFAGPGIALSQKEKLPGAYTAAAVAGLISSLPVQVSLTNKVLNIPGLAKEFTSSQLEKLVLNRVLAVEKREGFRIVKGITTATNSAWHQITTRRIVDYAIYGVRSACNPYIGKLNNERVRGAMKATIDAFLTRMVEDEALTGYQLEVSATRAQEIAGEAIVTMTIQPTFSIDFVKVTMYLQ